MRLHHLEITGFGPFPETVRIDFDSLSEAGLFLLSGPTGAGKSSVLDAVAFALYGDVPGDRSTAKRLRSDHAGADVVPRVVLEATMSGRRFRIDRSPSWQRPKKRGTGLTTEQARVVISERRLVDGHGQWHPLSTRLDETGHLVTRLLGLNLPQFCQVAMLPQGRFQAFLRATSQERHALLQQVFQTGRFDQVERWLREHRIALRRASESMQETVADLVSRVSEVTGTAPPPDWDAEPSTLSSWTSSLATSLNQRCAVAALLAETAASHENRADASVRAGSELAGRIAIHADATRCLGALEADAPLHSADVARLEAARRSLGVRPLVEVATSAGLVETSARISAKLTGEALTELLDVEVPDEARGDEDLLDAEWVTEQRGKVARLLSEVARLRPLQTQSQDMERELAHARRSLEDCRSELNAIIIRIDQLPDELSTRHTQREAAQKAAARGETLQQSVDSWTTRLEAADAAESLVLSLTQARAARHVVTEQRLLARESLVEIRERRLDGMAAEIAGQLAVGCCCPVCGSADHPSPAMPRPGAADETAERNARKEVDDLEAVVEAHTQQVRGLEMRLATARATAGAVTDGLSARLEQATSDLAAARQEAVAADDLTRAIHSLQSEQSRLQVQRDALVTAASQRETSVAVLTTRLDTVRAEFGALLGDSGHDDLDSLALHAQQIEAAAASCLSALAELVGSRHASREAERRVQAAADAAGFDTCAQAVQAWLSPSALVELETRIEEHRRDLRRVLDILSDPDVLSAASATVPDLDDLTRVHLTSKAAADTARRGHESLVDCRERLTGLASALATAIGEWEPLRADLDQVSELASFVEGKHPDNRLQMRLSAYVLAHRLSQVVEAANVRLTAMSDQRYSLVHTGQRGAGETRGGLSLLISDDWSGEARDPATLSGGETFVVSLALALGLADVITHESGGADLETLFVDEGFGALDADTLDDVMDTLDQLREGGRVVGVVSHVPEMQTRIPTQLRVHKARAGSRISHVLG